MILLFEDNFNGAGTLLGHVSDSGHTWLDPYPEYADDPRPKLTLSGGLLTVPTAVTYGDLRPSVSPTENFRFEFDVILGGALSSSESIDIRTRWGWDPFNQLGEASFSFKNIGGSNLLECYNQDTFAPDRAGPPGSYTLVIDRTDGVVKMLVNGVETISRPGFPSAPAGETLYFEFEYGLPSSHPSFQFNAVRMFGAEAVAEAFWTSFAKTTEVI